MLAGVAQAHTSSPFVWAGDATFVGGCDDLVALARRLKGLAKGAGGGVPASSL